MKRIACCIAFAMLCLSEYQGAFTYGQDQPKEIEIHAKRFSFTPGEITLTKGEPVTLEITADDTTHGLSIPELGVNASLTKGKAIKIQVTPQQTGTFVGRCNHFCGVGHGSMLFTVQVKDK